MMNPYTYQIGHGMHGVIHSLRHSEPVFAFNLKDAIETAKTITRDRIWAEDANLVRLFGKH